LMLPIKFITSRRANRRMETYFEEHAFHLRPVEPGSTAEGFVFTSLDAGTKVVHLLLMGHCDNKEFTFSLQVPGLKADYLHHDFLNGYSANELIDCDVPTLVEHLAKMPSTTTNLSGSRHGDPVNLVVAGDFATLLSAFGARWDETETITLATCW